MNDDPRSGRPINIYRATVTVDVVAIGAQEAEEHLADVFEVPEHFDLVDVKVELRGIEAPS